MVLTWPRLLLTYVLHLAWPVHLSVCYDVPVGTTIWPLLLLIVVVACLAWWMRNSSANVRFGALWFAVSLLPALAIRYITWDDYTHDRYLYLPSVGLALIAAEWLRAVRWTRFRSAAACVLAAVLCWGTLLNLRIWRDNIALFTRALETAPRNAMAKNNLAEAYLDAHREAEAFPLLQQLLRQYPAYILANRNMTRYYLQMGNLEEAQRYTEITEELERRQAR
jgi:tetratricopeptide (TPR) repeat protein